MAYAIGQQTAATQPTLIQVGPAAVWVNILPKPADGAFLVVSGYASGAQDQRVYGPAPVVASGTFLGSTVGDSTASYKPSFVDINIETSTAIVEKVLNTETARVNAAVAELTAENVQATLPGSFNNQPVATLTTALSPTEPGRTQHRLTVGGLRLVAPMCIAFISPNRRIGLAGVGPFYYVLCGYNAVPTEGFEAPFSRGKETTWRASYEMISDTSRTIGDQLFQFFAAQAS